MNRSERGSSLLLVIFMLAVLSATGISLLFLTQTDARMGQSDLRAKQAFYVAEAGLEDGRAALLAANRVSTQPKSLNDELSVAAGADGVFDFDPTTLVATWGTDGQLSGLSGFGDDVPLRTLLPFGNGSYAAFVTNDLAAGETATSPSDGNSRVILTGVGSGENRSLEIVQAVVRREDLFPTVPAAITILGEPGCTAGIDCAEFSGGSSNSKDYSGDDDGSHCPGGVAGAFVPVVGVIGSSSQGDAQSGVTKPHTYVSGADVGVDTVADLSTITGLDPMWTNCAALVEFAARARDSADTVGTGTLPVASLGTESSPSSVFINGDYTLPGSLRDGAGMLFVTGELSVNGRTGWLGPIFVIGKGDFNRSGGGNGTIAGGVVVADVAGPDRVLFTADDCSGQDGTAGTSDDGVAQSTYNVSGGGTSTTGYCSAYLTNWQASQPLEIVSFRQR